jgi:hypothetical protein
MMPLAQQSELFAPSNGWVPIALEKGGEARWRNESDDVIRLEIGDKMFAVSRQGRGRAGRARFYVPGVTNERGGRLQTRSLDSLANRLLEVLAWQTRHGLELEDLRARVSKVEIKTGISNTPAKRRKAEAEGAKARQLEREDKALAGDAVDDAAEAADAQQTVGRPARQGGNGKLCAAPVRVEWEQRRYIPKNAPGAFARVPASLIGGSREMASGEYRLLQAVLILAQRTGLLTAGKHKLARSAAIDPADVKRFRESLVNRGILRATGRTLKRGIIEYELLTHPALMDGESTDQGGEDGAQTGGNLSGTGGTVPPNKMNEKMNPEDESRARPAFKAPRPAVPGTPERTRAQWRGKEAEKKAALPALDELDYVLCELGNLIGINETIFDPPQGNRGLWITRYREDAVALREAMGEFKLKRDSGTKPRVSPAAMLTDDYKRIRDQRARA